MMPFDLAELARTSVTTEPAARPTGFHRHGAEQNRARDRR